MLWTFLSACRRSPLGWSATAWPYMGFVASKSLGTPANVCFAEESGTPTLTYHIVEAVLPRLSIQHLSLMIVEYKLRDEQDREQR